MEIAIMPSGKDIAVFFGIIAVVLAASRFTARFLTPAEARGFLRHTHKQLWEGVLITAGVYFLPLVTYGVVYLIYRSMR